MTITNATVYGKPGCVQCTQTTIVLNRKGVDHDYVDMTLDPEAMTAVQELGYASAPVVVVRVEGEEADRHWAGFRPDLIDEAVEAS